MSEMPSMPILGVLNTPSIYIVGILAICGEFFRSVQKRVNRHFKKNNNNIFNAGAIKFFYGFYRVELLLFTGFIFNNSSSYYVFHSDYRLFIFIFYLDR